eukprot:TRINITY_DN2281_c0_g1_i1.p1 TRINITY_DN2281_c0_g1~~TRINITY_DN2281_c0_g1_i1.p1  ORF type:complete len:554 (-),score=87.29 TRINITY_DN2281_c0_g1_i1:284-1945(-)
MVTTSQDQPVVKSFKNNFWNADIGNFQGFEVIVKRLKDGRSVCKEYVEFLRQRSLIEEQYGKALIKLAKTTSSRDEISSVRPAWDSVKNHTEAVGLNHVQASNQLAAEVAKISDFIDSSRDKRKWSEDNVRTLQTQIKTVYKRMVDSKKGYEIRCREEIQANHLFHQEVARTGRETSGAERAHGKHSKARMGMEQAEEAYRSAAVSLEETRALWQKETESCVDTFQELESSRLTVLRDSAWKVTNIGSACCVADDEVYEDTRKCLESCDLDEGLQHFIAQHETGSEGPPPVTCESLPNSSTLGMGHMARQRQLTNSNSKEKQYDTYSLGRTTPGGGVGVNHTPNTQSLTHLSEIGRSRSDLGYTPVRSDMSQSHVSLHTDPKTPLPHLSPNDPANLPPTRPKKPPRMIQYPQTSLSPGKSVHEVEKPISIPITSVENTEYYTLPDHLVGTPSSDYNSDQSAEFSYDSSPPAKQSFDFPISNGRRNYSYPITTPHRRRAVVLCEYRRKSISEISLSKNNVVGVLEGSHNSEWWRVETETGIQGFYPANFLRQIQ